MKKFFPAILFIFLSVSMILIFRSAFPKNSGFLMVFLFLVLADIYVWDPVRNRIEKTNRVVRMAVTTLFWLPFATMSGLTIYGLTTPFFSWGQPVRTMVTSLVLSAYLAKIFPLLVLLMADFVGIVTSIRKRKPWFAFRKRAFVLYAGWVPGFILFVILLYGMFFGIYQFKVHEQTISVKGLPASFDGFRIVQFSDLHLGSWTSVDKLAEAVALMGQLRPDVVFFTGDMFNYSTADGKGFEPWLSRLKAPFGVYAILGNHDYGDYRKWPSAEAKIKDQEAVKGFYKTIGWTLLLNDHRIIHVGSDSIAIIGVENWGAVKRFQRTGDLKKAAQGTENMTVQLLLSHDPTHWDSIVSKSYPEIDITFSGHTHGGQVGIDFWGIHWAPAQWMLKQWCGLYKKTNPTGNQYLYVNQGLGSIGYAGRVGIKPEITLIVLKTQTNTP